MTNNSQIQPGDVDPETTHAPPAQEEYCNPNKNGERPESASAGLSHLGEGAERLGLRGTVTEDQVKSLLEGFHPETDEPLRQTAGKRTKPSHSVTPHRGRRASAAVP